MPRHEKHKDRGYKSYNPDDFSYWDPYYVDSDAAQKYKRDIDYDVDNPYLRGTTTESSAGAEDPDPEFIPALALTGVFGAAFLILPFLVKKGPNRGIVQCCIMLTVFCMWIFWVTIYIGQMNPLMGPRLENTTVAWIAHKLGNAVARSGGSNSSS